MFRLSIIRRRLLLGAGYLLVLSGLSLMVVHTSLVRRFALVQMQIRLGNAVGLVIDAKDLDYNLFLSRFELRDITVKGIRLTDMPAPVGVQRIQLVLPIWRLIRGSLDTARIRIDGLSIHWLTARGGRSNWPPITGFGGGGNGGGPAVLVTSGDFYLQDDRNGLLIRLPLRQLSAAWDAVGLKYGIAAEGAAGSLQWNDSRLPLDRVQLKSDLGGGGFSLEYLRLESRGSGVELSGSLSGSPARIEAIADLSVNARDFGEALALTSPARGRLRARLSATGPISDLQLQVALRGEDLSVSGIPIRRPMAEMSLNTGSGEVRVKDLSAGVLGGKLTASGKLWIGTNGGRSELAASLKGLDTRQLAGLFGSAHVPPGQAAVEVTASWPGLDWRLAAVSGAARLRSAKVAFAATARPDFIHGSFDSTLGDGATMHGDIGFGLASHALTGLVHGRVDRLAPFGSAVENLLDRPPGSLNLPAVGGAARWSATLGGTTALPSASLQLDVNGLSAAGWTGADLQVTADYTAGRIGIERARLAWAGQQIEAKGEIGGTSADAPLRLDGTIQNRSLAGVFANLGVSPSVEAALSGGFRLTGTIARPVAEITLRTGPLTAYGERFSRANLDARWQGGELVLSRFVMEQDHESGAPGRLEASGSLEPTTGRYSIEAAGRDLRPTSVVLPGSHPLTGSFQIQAHGEGMLSDPVFSTQLDASDVRAGETALGELHANVNASGHHATALLTAPAWNAQVTSTIAMEGAWPFELTVESRNTHLETTPAVSFGSALHANGTLAPPQLERAAAAIDNLRLATHSQEIRSDGPIELSYADDRIKVEKLALTSGTSVVRLSGDMPLRDGGAPGSLALQGTVNLESLSQFLPQSEASLINGVVDVSVTVAGSTETWQPTGSVTIHDGRFRWQPIPLAIENISGRVNLQDGVIRLDGVGAKAGTGTLRIDGSLPLRLISDALPAPSVDAAQPARFRAQLDKLELSGGSGEQAVTAAIGAKLEGEAPALSLPALHASVEFSELGATTKNSHLQQTGPTRITIAGSVARLEHFDFGGASGSLRAAGTMGLAEGFPLQLEAAGQTNLAFLSVLAAPLEAAGALQLDVRVGGTLSAPKTTGFVKLDNASMVLPNPQLQAANVKLAADLDGDHITVKELTGTLNGGAFTGGGDLKVGAGGLHDVNLFLKGKDTFTEYPIQVKTTSSLDVKFVSDQNRLVLKGQIEVQEGYYESAIDLFSRSDKALKTGPEGPQETASNPVALDLKIVTRRPVEMDNNLGRVSATADLRLAGNVKKVGLLGALELEPDGKLYFGDRTYYIERGTVRFLDESRVTPELNIQAYTRTGDYTIKLGLTGKLDEITTTFTSDPPLSRDDVIAVLLTGKTVADNRGVDLRALEAASLATGAMNTALSSQAHRTFGVSRVSIQPAAIAAESNNPGARITITQDFTSSLRLLYSMNLSDSNDQIWVGEYDLSRRFTTRMVKQSDNTYRGEFRHDVRFGSSSSAAGTPAVRKADRKISDVRFTGAGPFTPEALAKVFKVKPGQKYKAIKVRKGSERLTKLFMKKGYLESRVRMDREDSGQAIGLTVRIELGPTVELAYRGADLPKGQRSRVRNAWHAGISDLQRPKASKNAILGYFAQKGFFQAQADVQIANDRGRKTVRFDLQPGIHYRGVKIAVDGADREHTRQILSMVHDRAMRLAVYRDPSKAAEAITRYYQQRGYLAANVAPPVQKLDAPSRTGRIVILVAEGPVFHVGDLQFSGNQALTAEDLRTGVPLESGAAFEPARLDPTVAALKQKYGKLGYREAQIEYAIDRHDDRASVDVSFTVVENQQTSIGAIKVEGNRRTSDKFARGRLRVAEGGMANTELIKDSVKNLSQTGAYTSADIQLRPPAESGASDKHIQVADLVVAVAEPKPFRLLYGGLYDSGNGPGFIADFQVLNSLGAGRTLGLRTRVDSETDEARLYVTRPFFRQQRLSTTIATYFTRETPYHQTTPTEKLGVSLQQDLQLRSKWLLSYGYRYEKQRGFVPDPAAPDIPVNVVAVAPVTLTLSRDARDSFLDATRGSFISHGFELAPRFLGSDYPYVRYYGQYFKYFSLTRPRPVPFGEKEQRSHLVFATGTRLGVQKGFDATGAVLTDRFYAGGGTTVRGFRQDELGPRLANGEPAGGNAVLVLNEELRYPLIWIFDAVTFVDIGNVYPRVTDFRLSELRTAGGFGLRIRNPFVVLRFDYGFKFGRRPGETVGAFFFSIGQAF